jgi:hypothetical protein
MFVPRSAESGTQNRAGHSQGRVHHPMHRKDLHRRDEVAHRTQRRPAQPPARVKTTRDAEERPQHQREVGAQREDGREPVPAVGGDVRYT